MQAQKDEDRRAKMDQVRRYLRLQLSVCALCCTQLLAEAKEREARLDALRQLVAIEASRDPERLLQGTASTQAAGSPGACI